MPTIITTPIPSIDTSWENYSGQQVEAFIKSQLTEAKDAAAASVQGVVVNGTPAATDTSGNAIVNIDQVGVDASLDTTSHNAIENAVVASKFSEIEDLTPASMDTDESPTDPDNMLQLTLRNKAGGVIAQTDIPKGNAETVVSRAYVTAAIDKARVKKGGTATLTWSYDHRTDGTSDGIAAAVTIRIRCGTTVTYEETTPSVAAGTTATMELQPYLLEGTTEVYVIAASTDSGGHTETRQAYASILVAILELTSSFDIAAMLTDGGYAQGAQLQFPYYVNGSGSKTVTLYIDGTQVTGDTVNAQSQNRIFYIDTAGLAPGRHNIQVVAESGGILSQSLFRDFLIQGATVPYIGCAIDFDDGRVYTDAPIIPTIDAKQFDTAAVTFVAWTPESNTSEVSITQGGETVSALTVNRTRQQYATQYTSSGTQEMAIATGATIYPFYFRIAAAADIAVEEATAGIAVRLLATGRSNTEADRDDWGGITTFEGVDWQSSGWLRRTATDSLTDTSQTFDVLRLINGARATIDYRPFATDARATGCTIEMELYLSNVSNRDAAVVECANDAGLGFRILAKEARLDTGMTQEVATSETDDQGNTIYRTRPIGVAMDIASDMLLRISFVIDTQSQSPTTREGNRLMMLYINGILSRVDRYTAGFNFIHTANPQPITIDSAHADVDIRSVRIYRRALSANEILENYIVDRPSYEGISEAYTRNAVTNDMTGAIDLAKILAKGKGAMVIIPKTSVDAANAKNDKSADFDAEKVYWYSPFGEERDFVASNCIFRIQGTSSTKYPRKNYRIYLAKTASGHEAVETTVVVGNSRSTSTGGTTLDQKIKDGKIKGNKYALRQGGEAANLFCMKADYSDSSMTMNTGGAKLFDAVMKELGLFTPPQLYQQDGGEAVTKRQAIDGLPCDLFVMDREGGATTYYGQYNLNFEKSKSEEIFGMKEFDDFAPTCPIALESLNNSNPFCLFQSEGSATSAALEQQQLQRFDAGFEFNYPEDTYYNPDTAAEEDGTEATTAQKTAIRRLMGWLYDVTPQQVRTMDDAHAYGDTTQGIPFDPSLWVSERFKSEVSSYFDVQHLCTYYLFTEYWASVDQRAKNILWRTWDGLKWYATFYDGDTAMSIRNDGFMAYLYNMTRDTYDDEALKYAYEGHDSRLWCLVLANLGDQLTTAANALRTRLTTQRMLRMFNVEQMRNWSERQYNESGWFKYVAPLIEGVQLNTEQGGTATMQYNYLYALNGSREAHRTSFLTLRAALLDARYKTSSYTDDRIAFYLSKADTAAQTVRILSGDLYYYGYRLNNGRFFQEPTLTGNGEWCELTFDQAFQLGDPLNLCGASRILELDWTAGPTLFNPMDMGRCTLLQSLNMSAANGGTRHLASLQLIGIANCTMLHTMDITGQNGISTGTPKELDLSALTRLATLRAGGTGLAQAILAEGAPLTTLVLPATITHLTLRYLPQLRTLDMEGYQAVTHFNFAACPHLDWQQLLDACANVAYIRVEGITGRLHPSVLRKYQGYGGIDEQGNIDTARPRFVGEVTLTQVVTDGELQTLRAAYPEMTIHPSQYSEYVFHDVTSSPANISNMDNRTGYAFIDPNATYDDPVHPNGYQASGHVALLHDMAQPVRARYAKAAGETEWKMTAEPISKTDYTKMADGTTDAKLSDPEGMMYDFFLHLPRYLYKGVNFYRNGTKHLFLSTLQDPLPSYTRRTVKTLAEIRTDTDTAYAYIPSAAIVMTDIQEGLPIQTTANASHDTYRIPVEGMQLVRFPSLKSASIGSAFTTADGTVIAKDCLQDITTATATAKQNATAENPIDIDPATVYGYDILNVPAGAAYLYFAVPQDTPTAAKAIAADTDDLEAMEEWVEHHPELIGLWQATKDASGNIRSRSPLVSEESAVTLVLRGEGTSGAERESAEWTPYIDDGGKCTKDPAASGKYPIAPPDITYYNATDLLNLCQLRGPGYHAITYETSKNLANILMAWFGTREVEAVIGRGNSPSYNPGHYRRSSASYNYADTTELAGAAGYNNAWGMEALIGCTAEWTEGMVLRAASFYAYLRNKRVAMAAWASDTLAHIVERWEDIGTERTLPMPADGSGNVMRVSFGRHCDIVASARVTDASYATYYAAVQTINSVPAMLSRRGGSTGSNVKDPGLTYLYAHSSRLASNVVTTRLCYTGPYTISDP